MQTPGDFLQREAREQRIRPAKSTSPGPAEWLLFRTVRREWTPPGPRRAGRPMAHGSVDDVASMAQRANVKRLVLTHFGRTNFDERGCGPTSGKPLRAK
ncbi:MAG: hypothetical protein OEN50_14180 [Deltaproteobacteria bacterium]|nr:hypothetical protein [Deltaproteobacteria bacterium]